MNFGDAIKELTLGKRLQRAGWYGKGLFVYLVPAASYPVQTGPAKEHFGAGAMVPYNAYLAIKNVDETVSTRVPSVNACLADAGCGGLHGLAPPISACWMKSKSWTSASPSWTSSFSAMPCFANWGAMSSPACAASST